ncbi:MAG: hypothetical protein FJW39_12015 [Acidobacteria bacterium]|nr:hypothetical protein [Acidobacteriota bacterium]
MTNRVKQILAAGGTAWGAASMGVDPLAAKLTSSTGADFVWFDTEHASYGVEAIEIHPALVRQSGVMPMIRVAGLDAVLIKKALDIGAQAVMIPQVDTAEQARRAVEYAKYPPQGQRGVSPMWTFYNDVGWDSYLPHANDEVMVVVQIESRAGLENAEEIARVEGVDVLFAGPMDLSASFEVIGNTAAAEVERAVAELPAKAAAGGRAAGISVGGGAAAERVWRLGYRFISVGNLYFQGVNGLRADLARLKGLDPGQL